MSSQQQQQQQQPLQLQPDQPEVVILHDNEPWTQPLTGALAALGVTFRLVHVQDDFAAFKRNPAAMGIDWARLQVLLNRVSPSHRRRGNNDAVANTNDLLLHARRASSGLVAEVGFGNAWRLELSKWEQYVASGVAGLPVLPTVRLSSAGELLTPLPEALAAERLLVKPDIGGSGYGLTPIANGLTRGSSSTGGSSPPSAADRAATLDAVRAAVRAYGTEDGAVLQEFVPAADDGETSPPVFRYEFVRGRLVYVLRIDPDDAGAFDNCPADVCERPPAAAAAAAKEQKKEGQEEVVEDTCQISHGKDSRFRIVAASEADAPHPHLIPAMKRYTEFADSLVCGIEVIERPDGSPVVIDINSVNTNYNARAERRAKVQVTPVELMAADIQGTIREQQRQRSEVLDQHRPVVSAALARMFPGLERTEPVF